eukprot:NODE_7200_length_413_cov_45.945055_g5562_i0.p3 GENE.NODE_7200_length_413_cov_45.945055_g5562_i0~~NODE_7200_length_413_cov_45.945055_g5562_i0.p3  ORF type:complete len:64 (-),score=3.02 NODE_7200_length_413_cov_45.945055_g5562_i0:142-333(-)
MAEKFVVGRKRYFFFCGTFEPPPPLSGGWQSLKQRPDSWPGRRKWPNPIERGWSLEYDGPELG